MTLRVAVVSKDPDEQRRAREIVEAALEAAGFVNKSKTHPDGTAKLGVVTASGQTRPVHPRNRRG